MASQWHSPLISLPEDLADVWIVRTPFYDTPAPALFDQDTLTFKVTVAALELSLPAPDVWKWRLP